MSERVLPRYPIYIPSKGRWTHCLTAQFLRRDGVPFYLVVEPQEEPMYAEVFGAANVLTLPFSNLGSVIPARNWIKDHATAAGYARHWQLDDNIRKVDRWWRGKRIACAANVALAATEDFADRYENVAIAGLNYRFFAHHNGKQPRDPFWLNVHVYSCTLFLNSLPHRWRGRYNEDTDICLQVLADGWCTVAMNAFMADKMQTMTMRGGNAATLYQGDGRLKMARALERQWPGVVTTSRRFNRPQHMVRNAWKHFDTPLRLKPEYATLVTEPNEYGSSLVQVKPIKSAALRQLVAEHGQGRHAQ